MAKETYSHGKRDLFTWQKRPIHMAKETYYRMSENAFCVWVGAQYASVSRETYCTAKETYYTVKETY